MSMYHFINKVFWTYSLIQTMQQTNFEIKVEKEEIVKKQAIYYLTTQSLFIILNFEEKCLKQAISTFQQLSLTLSLIRQFCSIFCQKIENLYNWMDNLWLKEGKHCGKRRNCLFWAISSFVSMLSKSRLLQRHQKASIWGKGLTLYWNLTSNFPNISILALDVFLANETIKFKLSQGWTLCPHTTNLQQITL